MTLNNQNAGVDDGMFSENRTIFKAKNAIDFN
jgi:hypothetical protein